MGKAVSEIRKAQTAHSWGILLGMVGIPVMALFSKIYPQYDTGWQVGMAVFGLIVIRSTIGYLFPGLGSSAKKDTEALTQSH